MHTEHMTVEEVGQLCGRSKDTVRRWIRSGVVIRGVVVHLPVAASIGNEDRVSPEGWKQFTERCRELRHGKPKPAMTTKAKAGAATRELRRRLGR